MYMSMENAEAWDRREEGTDDMIMPVAPGTTAPPKKRTILSTHTRAHAHTHTEWAVGVGRGVSYGI